MFQQIEKTTNPHSKLTNWQNLESGYQVIKNITLTTAMKYSALKLETDDEIYQLQIKLGSALSQIEQLQLNMLDYMGTIFNQQHMNDTLKQLESSQMNYLANRIKFNELETIERFENKFENILTKINKTSIEVELTKHMIQS